MLVGWILRYFATKQCKIFWFRDGSKVCYVDTLKTFSALLAHPTYTKARLAEALNGSLESALIVAQAANDVFGVQSFDGNADKGLTVSERIELLAAFELFVSCILEKGEANRRAAKG